MAVKFAAVILFVDMEHPSAHDKDHGDFVLAWRTRVTYRLQDIAGETCLLQPHWAVDQELLDRRSVKAMFLSGSSTDPDQYGSALEGVQDVIRSASVPMFGLCGGFQFMMEAHGAPIERIGPLAEGEEKSYPEYMPGWKTETGYLPVHHNGEHQLLNDLGERPVFRQFHGWEIRSLPAGFENLASTPVTVNQLAVNEDLKQAGSQFHPEYYTDEHPAGRTLIENFLRWSGALS